MGMREVGETDGRRGGMREKRVESEQDKDEEKEVREEESRRKAAGGKQGWLRWL
jgi:hypothetical protein